jgi:predicted RND superfamily exporter protein
MRQRQHGDIVGTSTPRAVVFSGLTTIASFGALALSDHLGLASMGQLLTIAILWSLVCTLVVLPAMLVVSSRERARAAAAGPP